MWLDVEVKNGKGEDVVIRRFSALVLQDNFF